MSPTLDEQRIISGKAATCGRYDAMTESARLLGKAGLAGAVSAMPSSLPPTDEERACVEGSPYGYVYGWQGGVLACRSALLAVGMIRETLFLPPMKEWPPLKEAGK